MAKQLPRLEKCLNCGTAVTGNYCAHCGQENEDQTVAMHDLLADLMAEVIAIDSKLFRTIVPLLTRPGYITQQYNAGKRIRYLSPLKMYLVASLVFFLVASFKTPPASKIHPHIQTQMPANAKAALTDALKRVPQNTLTHRQLEQIAAVTTGAIHSPQKSEEDKTKAASKAAHQAASSKKKAASVPAPPADKNETSPPESPTKPRPTSDKTSSPPPVAETPKPQATDSDIQEDGVPGWVKGRVDKLRQDPKALIDKALDTAPKVMFVVLPLFALTLQLLYARRKRLYVEHLIFGLHFHAFIFAALALVLLIQQTWFTIFVVCYIHLYLLIAMRKVYDQGYPKTLIKYFLLTSCYSVLLIMGIGAVFAIAFATL